MTRDLLPDLEDEPLAVRTLFPDPEYFQSWSQTRAEKQDAIAERFEGEEPDIVGITHTDADGYGCEVMLREAYPNKDIQVVTAAEGGPLQVEVVGEYVMDHISDDTPLFIMDLAPNAGEGRQFIDPFRNCKSVTVIDHHEWDEEDHNQIDWVAEVHHDTDRCATQIVHDVLIEDPREEITELSELTADHDLWLKEERERSDALSDLVYAADREEYVELAREYGDSVVASERGREVITAAQEERRQKTELALNRTTFHDVNGYRMAIAYGGCNSSDVGEKLYTEYEADLACVIFPNGKLSFRSPDEVPIARDAATSFGGGGHPCAAGANPDFVGQKIDYTTHWATKGDALRTYVVDVIRDSIE